MNRGKPEEHRDRVLMIDARNVYRKVTRKIYDFSPEQGQNLVAIVWLYRGQPERFLGLVAGYCTRLLGSGDACFSYEDNDGKVIEPLPEFTAALETLREALQPFLSTLGQEAPLAQAAQELDAAARIFVAEMAGFEGALKKEQAACKHQKTTNEELKQAVAAAWRPWPKPAGISSSRWTCSTSWLAG